MENLQAELKRLRDLYNAVEDIYSEGLYNLSEAKYWRKLIRSKIDTIKYQIRKEHSKLI